MGIFNWYAHKIIHKTQSLADVAYKRTVIAPEEAYVHEPVPMLDGMLERVTGTDPHTNLDDQFKIARGGKTTHAATLAYHVRNARILRSGVYAGGFRKSMDKLGVTRDAIVGFNTEKMRIKQGILTTNYVTYNWFGEWLLGENANALLAERLNMPALELVRDQPYGHAARYRELFELSTTPVRNALVDELIIIRDMGHNADRRKRFQELRRRALKVTGKYHDHGVFLVRGRHGQLRLMENEQEAMNWAEKIGFKVVDPMTMSVDEVLAELRDARLVVGVESSAMLHAAFVMQPEGCIVSIVPPDRFCINNCDFLRALDIGYALMVAEPNQDGSFHANLGELEATIELAVSRT